MFVTGGKVLPHVGISTLLTKEGIYRLSDLPVQLAMVVRTPGPEESGDCRWKDSEALSPRLW